MITFKRVLIVCMTLCLSLFFTYPASANNDGNTDTPWERGILNIGGFITSISSNVRVGSDEFGTGIDIDLEKALGLEESSFIFRVDGQYRIGERRVHAVDFSYIKLNRSATVELGKDIEFKDRTFTVGTTVDSLLDLQVVKVGYNYYFYQDDRFAIGAGGGFFVMPIDVGISAGSDSSEDESITAPLPVIGLRTDFAITPKLFLKQQVHLFYIKYNNFLGSLLDASVLLEYNIWKNVGLGMGINTLRFRFEAVGEDYPSIDFSGDIKFGYTGLMIYAKLFY